jgi:hypothetical protein
MNLEGVGGLIVRLQGSGEKGFVIWREWRG